MKKPPQLRGLLMKRFKRLLTYRMLLDTQPAFGSPFSIDRRFELCQPFEDYLTHPLLGQSDDDADFVTLHLNLEPHQEDLTHARLQIRFRLLEREQHIGQLQFVLDWRCLTA